MDKEQIIQQTAEFLRTKLAGDSTGHDWLHTERVWNNAKHIGVKENVDMFVVELASLLHDVADYKFHDFDTEVGPTVASDWLVSIQVPADVIDHVCKIIKSVSYRGGTNKPVVASVEFQVVQDADRLDAIGAIGIARAFSYGGHKGRPIFDPAAAPKQYKDFEDYKSKQGGSTINHFYEKLLKLKDLMNTKTGHELAQKRHDFMVKYLDEFFSEIHQIVIR